MKTLLAGDETWLSPTAACGVPGYAFQGIYMEMRKNRSASVQESIIAARIAQGQEEWNMSSSEQRLKVVRRWQAMQLELRKENKKTGPGSSLPVSDRQSSLSTSSSNQQLPSDQSSRPVSSSPSAPTLSSTPGQAESRTSRNLPEGDGYQAATTPPVSGARNSSLKPIHLQQPQVQRSNTSHSISRKPVPSPTLPHREGS